ncbi:MAG TPA: hypothetical protein PLB55_21480, partial [Prosthecobacter sp.]|nr:hypothetical protein [Prosthecobacter sp.]
MSIVARAFLPVLVSESGLETRSTVGILALHLMSALIPFDHQPRTRLVFGNGTLSRIGELA